MGRWVGQKTLEKIGRHMWMAPNFGKGHIGKYRSYKANYATFSVHKQ